MAGCLATLRAGCAARDTGSLVAALQAAIPDYTPSDHVLARIESSQRAAN
jgi:hypothetical protein